MEFIVLDLDNATEEQLVATIDCNNRTARLMKSEIEKLKRVAETAKKKKKLPVSEIIADVKSVTSEPVDEDFENEVEYYLSLLKELTLENIESEISTVLPSRKHYQYERILNRLKLETIRNMKEIKELFQEEGISIDEVPSFQEEFNLEMKKLHLITKALEPQANVTEEEEQQENNLIFVPTLGGDIRVLHELDSIPFEYYDKFYGLFQSIKDGTFKNAQRFIGHNELVGLCEVKDFKVRVVFVRLNRDSYAVISAFTKKTDNDKGYRASLIKKYCDYKQVEDSLIRNLSNPEFMAMQKDYEAELFRRLSPSTDKMPVVKKKGGDA